MDGLDNSWIKGVVEARELEVLLRPEIIMNRSRYYIGDGAGTYEISMVLVGRSSFLNYQHNKCTHHEGRCIALM